LFFNIFSAPKQAINDVQYGKNATILTRNKEKVKSQILLQRRLLKDDVDTEMKDESQDVYAGDKSDGDGEGQEGPPNQDAADKEPLLARDYSI